MAFLFVVHLCYISKRTMLHRETFWTNPLSQIYGKVFGFGLSELTKIIQMAPYLGFWYTITYRKEVQGSHRLYIETNRLYIVPHIHMMTKLVSATSFITSKCYRLPFLLSLIYLKSAYGEQFCPPQSDKSNNNDDDDISMWTLNT